MFSGGYIMGNIISFDGTVSVDDDSISMSNGLTDVFIDYLLISGSQLAESKSEKRMIVFLAEKQQAIIGMGTVGFDITEMPWQTDSFEADKTFMLGTINNARLLSVQRSVWNKLGYEPNQKLIEYALSRFEALIKRMTINDIDENNLEDWCSAAEEDDPVNCGFPKCSKHGVLLSFCGCKLCNDGM